MATERNTLVSADEAQKLLDGTTPGPWDDVRVGREGNGEPRSHEEQVCGIDAQAVAIVTHDGSDEAHANTRLMYAAPDLAETVVALHAEVKRLSTANIDLLDTLRAVARACTLPEDTAPASLPAQVESCLRDLSRQIERLTSERDNAVAKAQQLARVLDDAATPEDAVQLLSAVLVQDAASAPNCAEWRGSYSGREFAITVQWVDGKSPHALIDEARRERDDLRTQLASTSAALDSERTVTREMREATAFRQREIAALLPDDPAQWSPVDIASALVMARQEIERLRSAAVPSTIQAAMEALKPLAAQAYRSITLCEGDPPEHLHEPIRPDYDADNSEDPRIVLALHLGGVDGPLWQASVEYEGDMGSIPVDAGNHANDPLGALAELRASLEAEDATDEGDDDDTESD